MNTPDRTRERKPVVDGYLSGSHVVILNCPLCGGVHLHGNAKHIVGELTPRTAYCRSEYYDSTYIIKIKGELTEEQHKKQVRKIDEPRPKNIREPRYIFTELKTGDSSTADKSTAISDYISLGGGTQ